MQPHRVKGSAKIIYNNHRTCFELGVCPTEPEIALSSAPSAADCYVVSYANICPGRLAATVKADDSSHIQFINVARDVL